MRKISPLTLAFFAAAGLTLSACSEKTQDNAAETATSASEDVGNMAADASTGMQSLGTSASNAANEMDTAASATAADANATSKKASAAAKIMADHMAAGAREAKEELIGSPSAKPTAN